MKQLAAFLLALLFLPTLHAAEPLGRLFFTPAQRAMLDAGKELEKPKGTTRAVRGPRSLTVNGIVTRSDGESTVWVNGSTAGPGSGAARSASASRMDPASARIDVRGSERQVKLRVGQSLDRNTGTVTEAYEAPPARGNRSDSITSGKSPGKVENGADTGKTEAIPEDPGRAEN